MTPTPKLRFVERFHRTGIDGSGITTGVKLRILQQWWEDKTIALMVYRVDADGNSLPPLLKGEWRDIPLENEHE
jgi:hypothetical protein